MRSIPRDQPQGPSVDRLAELASDLVATAHRVHSNRWRTLGDAVTGDDLLAVAVLLDNTTVLTAADETVETVLAVWATTLWGIDRGRRDIEDDLILTRAWFARCADRLESLGISSGSALDG